MSKLFVFGLLLMMAILSMLVSFTAVKKLALQKTAPISAESSVVIEPVNLPAMTLDEKLARDWITSHAYYFGKERVEKWGPHQLGQRWPLIVGTKTCTVVRCVFHDGKELKDCLFYVADGKLQAYEANLHGDGWIAYRE